MYMRRHATHKHLPCGVDNARQTRHTTHVSTGIPMKGNEMPENKTKVIDEMEFQVPQPYTAGHTVTDAEARALNQLLSENIGNNMRAFVKKAKEEGKSEDEIRSHVADYAQRYTFAMPSEGGGGKRLDPVEREALNIAKEIVREHLKQQGRKVSQVPEGMSEDDWKAKLQENYDNLAQEEAVLAQAKKNVAAKKKTVESLSQSLGL